MNDDGLFAVHRGVFKHPMFDGEEYSRREAWLWLLGNAHWKPTKVRSDGKIAVLQRGQLMHSLRFLAVKFRWSKSKVQRFLCALETDTMIETTTGHGSTLISICNYEDYQFGGDVKRDTNETPIDTRVGQERDKEEELKKERKEEEESKSAALRAPPPDVSRETSSQKPKRTKARSSLPDDWKPNERDLAHATEHGFDGRQVGAMAAGFSNHHRARGNLMADWGAAWRTWCDNEIKFQRSNGYGQGRSRTLQDDNLSVSKAIDRRLSEPGTLIFPPRPTLLPVEREDDRRLLPAGRSAKS